MQVDFHLARDRFLKAGIPAEMRDLDSIRHEALLMVRLATRINAETGKIDLLAAPYEPSFRHLMGEQFMQSISVSAGLHAYQIRALANAINAPSHAWSSLIGITHQLYACHIHNDALITVLDPVVLLPEGRWLVFGGSLTIDTNALFRQPESARLSKHSSAVSFRVTILNPDAHIAVVTNGAGVGMLLLDDVQRAGGNVALLIDTGMTPTPETLHDALGAALATPHITVIVLVLILTPADHVPTQNVLDDTARSIPAHMSCVIVLGGAAHDRHTLPDRFIYAADTEQAAQHTVRLVTLSRKAATYGDSA